MMARTRKRDDDSQCNSEATSLAALDASSMSAAGSRSSRTFASSTKALNGKQRRPTKRRRKSLTDALQSISLDKDKGVPQQILSSKMGGFPFSNNNNNKSFAFSTIARNGNGSGKSSPLIFASLSEVPSFSNLNSKQRAGRQIDRESSGAEGDGDIYYDDDNSQLTSSSDEQDDIGGVDGMDDDYDDDEEDEEDSLRKRLALMTDFEKAQREVMLKLVFGKDHKDSSKRKTEKISSFSGPREVSSCVRHPPGLIVDPVKTSLPQPSHPPPFATISTTVEAAKATPSVPIPKPLIPDKEDQKDKNEEQKDPVDHKIEELLRRSLTNLRKGSHPLRLSNSNDEDSDSLFNTPWKTKDDMAIDPQIYSRRVQHQQQLRTTYNAKLNSKTNQSMALDTATGSNDVSMTKAHSSNPAAQIPPFRLQRSNSLPGGLDMSETTDVAMDMDG